MYILSHYDVVAKKQLVGVLPRVGVLHHLTLILIFSSPGPGDMRHDLYFIFLQLNEFFIVNFILLFRIANADAYCGQLMKPDLCE